MSKIIERAAETLKIEADSILKLIPRLDEKFEAAVQAVLKCEGKVILTGIGKSGQIGRKLASTLSSTGTPSVFLHPAESSHGDLGVVTKKDLMIAKTAETINNGLEKITKLYFENLDLNFTENYAFNSGLISYNCNYQNSLSNSNYFLKRTCNFLKSCYINTYPSKKTADKQHDLLTDGLTNI